MKFIYKDSISVQDYNSLRTAVGWQPLCAEQAQQGLNNSAYIISCYAHNSIIGATRIIWDRGYIAYLSDVMVKPQYQHQGIGHYLVSKAIDFMKLQKKKDWRIKIVLVASKGKEGFYEEFGFIERPNAKSGAGMELWLK